MRDKNLINKLLPIELDQFASINPTNNKIIKTYDWDSESKIKKTLSNSQKSFEDWRTRSIDFRIEKLKRLAENMEKNKLDLASTITLEVGKPITESIGEVEKSYKHIHYYIKNATNFLKCREINFEGYENIVEYQPLGPILNIAPWNFPIWVSFKSVIGCLISGNSIILKPASRVPLTSLKLLDLFHQSGFEDQFQLAFLPHERIENELISDFRIRSVIFTGSTTAGSRVGELCGKHLKKTLLELGGSDPFIVMEDADLQSAIKAGAEGRLRNTGQACICAKRLIIHENIYDKYLEGLKKEVDQNWKIGDPTLPGTKQGPIARLDLFMNLKRQVIDTLENKDADLLYTTLEEIDDSDYHIEKGNYFKPLFLENIKKDSIARKEELFGPVFSLYKFKNEKEAIEIANETKYGLGASIFTKDPIHAEHMATKIDSGMVYINSSSMSDSRLPYGGIKNSGFGRTSADNAIFEFTNNKVISRKK